MDCVISTKLYNTIKELTIKGDLNSFEFTAYSKFMDISINEILNNTNYEELQGELLEFFYDNEFMFNGVFYPYVEEDNLKIKVTFTEDFISNSDEIDKSSIVTDFYDKITDKLEKRLGPEFDFDNLDLQMDLESNRESSFQLESFNLIYIDPESEEVINLSEDNDLKTAAINYFLLWGTENFSATSLLGEELDFSFSISIEESYLSSFNEFVYDIINLNIK